MRGGGEGGRFGASAPGPGRGPALIGGGVRPMPRRLLRIEKAGQFVNHAVGEAASLQSEARRRN